MSEAVRLDLPARSGDDGETVDGVALLTIDRPRVLNALDRETMRQLVEHLDALDTDPGVRCIVITGAGERAFAAGADITEMADATPDELVAAGGFERWDRVGRLATPTIAAVRGFALGGGFELALACDLLVAGRDARFGLPEVNLGVIPGAGGTQRLTRAAGQARAMEIVLTGRQVPAEEAAAMGLVSQLVEPAQVLGSALELAGRIAALPALAVRAAKAAVLAAEELPLSAGIAFERAAFLALFGSHDQREGMRAFLEQAAADLAPRVTRHSTGAIG